MVHVIRNSLFRKNLLINDPFPAYHSLLSMKVDERIHVFLVRAAISELTGHNVLQIT